MKAGGQTAGAGRIVIFGGYMARNGNIMRIRTRLQPRRLLLSAAGTARLKPAWSSLPWLSGSATHQACK